MFQENGWLSVHCLKYTHTFFLTKKGIRISARSNLGSTLCYGSSQCKILGIFQTTVTLKVLLLICTALLLETLQRAADIDKSKEQINFQAVHRSSN